MKRGFIKGSSACDAGEGDDYLWEEKKLDNPQHAAESDVCRRGPVEPSPHAHHVHFSHNGGDKSSPPSQLQQKQQQQQQPQQIPLNCPSRQQNSTEVEESPITRREQRHNFTIDERKSDNSTIRTKSWTDQRAPEPFSSPTQRQRRQKYGYGDLFGSTSGSNLVEDRMSYRHSYHSSDKSKMVLGNAFERRRSSDAKGATKMERPERRQPSFSELDFPVLSPLKKPASSRVEERLSSWSLIVGGQQQDEVHHTRADGNGYNIDVIPPLPFVDDVVSRTVDEDEPLNAPETSLLDAGDRRGDSWKECNFFQRQRSHSAQYHPPGKQISQTFPFPEENFDQMSIASLQNDIGTLLARSNQVDEAIERYKLSIESASNALKGLTDKIAAGDGEIISVISSSNDYKIHHQCPVRESEGLAWFRTKLLRGDVAPAAAEAVSPMDNQNNEAPFPPPFQPAGFGGCASSSSSSRRLRSSSFCAADLQPTTTRSYDEPLLATLTQSHSFRNNLTTHITPKPPIGPIDDIVLDIHQHQKLDCPEDVYSCNGRTPLGLEYICDPLPILGRSLRKLAAGLDDKAAMIMTETAALVAARLNLAASQYRIAGGGVSEKLEQVLETLKSCQSSFSQEDQDGRVLQSSNIFILLKAVAHANIGTCLYRLNKVREATQNFELAHHALAQYNDQEIDHDENSHESHDDDRFPPCEYILLVTRVNLARAMLRLNKHEEAKKLCDQIAYDNKPHRKNSSCRRLSAALPPRMYGFRRSSSFSATSSALETAIATYDHDIDRRSKWLCSVAEHFLVGLVYEARGEPNDHREAWHHYNRLLSLARTKLDHRHPYICSLLERRGAVLFSQRKLQCSLLSYLACLHVLEHQQSNGSNVFNQADLARVLYAVARVLHDKEEYHDALGMYHRALSCQREVSINSARPSLDVITTLCNISRVYHLSGDLDAALSANKEVLQLATLLVAEMDHPFLIHRLKVEGNILIEAGRLSDAMTTFVEAARRCGEDGRNQMMRAMIGGGRQDRTSSSQEDADAGDSSVLSIRSAATLAHMNCFHPGAAAA